jgi:Mg2+ and Co2+ transporter CorA
MASQMDSIINQRESRLSLKMAAQQSRLADISRRDSTSMKTLAILGSVFLPGTFLSSIFSMSFFNFGSSEFHISMRESWEF